eukprot:CAMPEP_0114589798 /NCGR_PEP_ID=MMETSP0125-20121206/12168_1 /TAXON_ID=485358 ORGANISM="Aristerostoma sp., Strain ATCC 50986" /NCGR_SAMPLE_ID=MMETSP0125 /ASSEMBLY_ACC=CAM_ASM_000245 /LENGTH=91 /DNA_ID=CAMNT_0001786889 /DNA_START=1724 /DNA_END=1999 /DNA_ORIENTATION=-
MNANPFGRVSDAYVPPTLEPEWTNKDNKTPVLNIEFSARGDMMAVSFDNEKISKDNEDGRIEKEGSYVVVYAHRNSPKFGKYAKNDKNMYS